MSGTALAAYPVSYSKLFSALWAADCAAMGTSLGRHSFVHFLKPGFALDSFAAEHLTEGRPTGIQHGFGQVSFGQTRSIDIAHGDVIELLNELQRFLVQKVRALIDDLGVDRRHLPSLVGALGDTELGFQCPIGARIADLFARREGGKVLQAQIDTDTANRHSGQSIGDLDHHIQKPVASDISGKAGTVLDFPFRQRAGVEHPKRVPVEAEGVPFALEVTAFKGNPTQRFLAAIAQIGPFFLRSGFSVLLARGVDRARVQAQFLAAANRQRVQVESGWPALVPLQRKLLSVVAEIPGEIQRAALFIQQAAHGFNAVTEHLNHLRIITYFSNQPRKTDRPSDGSLCLPGMNAGVSHGKT